MARRSEDESSVSVYQGRYHRTLGKVVDPHDKLVAKKFLLGTDKPAAEVANRLLEQLWNSVVAEHAAAEHLVKKMKGRLGDVNRIAGDVDYQRLRRVDRGPVWRKESLAIAEAIRKGQREVVVEVGNDANEPCKYIERIADLRREYNVIAFVPGSAELYAAGQRDLAAEAEQIGAESTQKVQELSSLAQAALPIVTGQTFYQALDAYAKYAVQKSTKAFGRHDAACALRLKDSHLDIPLSQFGISAMETIAAYWAGRPLAKKTGKPVALDTVTNHLKTARRFIKWLHRTDAFAWTKPVDADDVLRVRIAGLRNVKEIAALRNGVAVWQIDELATIYRYASDRERLLILLGLNCGFAHAEICTLRRDEIVDVTGGRVVKRVRHKSQVYGEFVLWPETVTATGWFVKWMRGSSPNPQGTENPSEYLMVTRQGRCYDRQQIANMWNQLLDRVQVDHPNFRRLPFKCLRKTAGQLIRERSDGEISGVFLCHGQAVASDSLADVYTNRPFNKVAATLALVRRDLQPMFDAVPDAFTRKPGSSPNISLGKIDAIRTLHAEGITQSDIGRATGVTSETVRRWIDRGETHSSKGL
jgi:integrase